MPPVTAPEPQLGRIRRVVLLPPGVGGALSFDRDGVELGNGWFDVSARLAGGVHDWLPPLTWSPQLGHAATFARSRKHGKGKPRAHPDEMLCDGGRNPFGSLRAGTLTRDSSTAGDPVPAYWLYAAGVWWWLDAIELYPPSAENTGPVGTIAEQVAIDPAEDLARRTDDAA